MKIICNALIDRETKYYSSDFSDLDYIDFICICINLMGLEMFPILPKHKHTFCKGIKMNIHTYILVIRMLEILYMPYKF